MVGSAGNAPVRRFRLCLATPDLQSGSRITSLENWCGCRELHPDFLRGGKVFWY